MVVVYAWISFAPGGDRPRALNNAAAACVGAAAQLSWGLLPAVSSGGFVLQRGLSRELLQRRDGGHALGREHARGIELPVLVLLQR